MKTALWALIILGLLHLPWTLHFLFHNAIFVPVAVLSLSAVNIITTALLIPVVRRLK